MRVEVLSGILVGGPLGIIVGIPALGLTVVQDVANLKNPDNENAKKIPTSVGACVGLAGDKLTEAVTGKVSDGLLQELGELAETLYSLKDIFKRDVSKPLEAIDKLNTLTGTASGTHSVIDKVQEIKRKEKAQREQAQSTRQQQIQKVYEQYIWYRSFIE